MSKIGNANIPIPAMMGLFRDAGNDQELRSTGRDLYVKQGQALFGSASSRLNHQANALILVKRSLANDFHISDGVAEQILTNVLGGASRPMTVGDLRTLNELRTDANDLHVADGTDMAKSFEIAQHARSLGQSEGLGKADALKVAVHAAAWIDQGISPEDARMGARLVHVSTQGGIGEAHARDSVAIGLKLATGLLDSRGALTALGSLPALERDPVFLETLHSKMDRLNDYDSAGPGEKQVWTRLADAFGTFISSEDAQKLPTDHKISLSAAQARVCLDRATADDREGLLEGTRGVAHLNAAYTDDELILPEDTSRLIGVYHDIRKDDFLQRGALGWGEMSETAKKLWIKRLIELHAGRFDYNVPEDYLSLEDQGPGVAGGLTRDGKMILNNDTQVVFGNFASVFNTVIHESTHKYQQELVAKLKGGQLDPGDARFREARILNNNQDMPMFESALKSWGADDRFAYDAYRHQPDERQAYHMGDGSQEDLRRLFPYLP